MENKEPVLWYFADPMCSWCWGFSPVISEVKKKYADQFKIALVMGGLQPGESNVMSDSSKEEILHHWQQVKKMTGQDFLFDNALPKEFIYNTEPACRAVITVGLMDATKTFDYFTAIQAAFYTKNQDVTQTPVLQQLAVDCGLSGEIFNALFRDEKQQLSVEKSFQFTKKAGVQGFPTLILSQHEQLHVLARGYQDFADISGALDKLLSA